MGECRKEGIFKEGQQLSGTVIVIYAAVANKDDIEGRGQTVDQSYHRTQHDALLGASGIGVMGGDGEVRPRFALQLLDGTVVLLPEFVVRFSDGSEKAARLRRKALDKLSPAEKAALLGPSR